MKLTLLVPLSCLLLLAPVTLPGTSNRFVRASWALSLFEMNAPTSLDTTNQVQRGNRDSSPATGGPAASVGAFVDQTAGNLLEGLSGAQVQQLLEMVQNPVGSALQVAMPNTMQGLSTDMSNDLQMAANGAQRGFSSLSSQFSSAADQGQSGYGQVMNMANPNRYLNAASSSGDQLMRRVNEMLSNPEQMCRQLVQQTRSLIQSVQEQGSSMSPAGNQVSSTFNRFIPSSLFG